MVLRNICYIAVIVSKCVFQYGGVVLRVGLYHLALSIRGWIVLLHPTMTCAKFDGIKPLYNWVAGVLYPTPTHIGNYDTMTKYLVYEC